MQQLMYWLKMDHQGPKHVEFNAFKNIIVN